MSYISSRVGSLFAIRWTELPTLEDCDDLARDAREAHARNGAPVVFLGVIPVGLGMPEGPVRRRMQERMPALLEHLASASIVLEGSGLNQTLIRTLIRALAVASRIKIPMSFHSRLDHALAELKVGVDPARLVATLDADGVSTRLVGPPGP